LRGEPGSIRPILCVLFENGCGNLINLVQLTAGTAQERG